MTYRYLLHLAIRMLNESVHVHNICTYVHVPKVEWYVLMCIVYRGIAYVLTVYIPYI